MVLTLYINPQFTLPKLGPFLQLHEFLFVVLLKNMTNSFFDTPIPLTTYNYLYIN